MPRHLATAMILAGSLLAPTSTRTAAAETLSELRAGAPGVISALVETGFLEQQGQRGPWPAPGLNLAAGAWRVNGISPVAIHRYSLPVDALPARRWSHPVKVRHRVYLDLGAPLQDGTRYRVESPYGSLTLEYADTRTRCEAIKVNQGGYHPGLADRFANLGIYLGDGGSRRLPAGSRYEVREADSGRRVAGGEAAFLGDDTGQGDPADGGAFRSGEFVYRLSLADVPSGGPYFVSVPGCGRSADFRIGIEAVTATARLALRGIYHQRCGVALTQPYTRYTRGLCAPSHRLIADTRQPFAAGTGDAQGWIAVSGREPLRPVVGGWHDAGDFDRRASHLAPLLWWLSYYEALGHLPPWNDDGWLTIPESGNGVPDFLDEAMWALRSWRALQLDGDDPDRGAVLAGTEAGAHPGYGEVSAASDTLRYGSYAIDRRVTAWSAGAFAQLARLLQPHDPAQAQQWLSAAEAAWQWLATQATDDLPVASAYAAMQLFLSTGDDTYHQAFRQRWAAIESGATPWPEQCVPQNAGAQCQLAQFAMYFHPRHRALADPAIVRRGLQRIEAAAVKPGYQCDHPADPPPEPYPQCLRAWGDWGRQVTTALRSDAWVWAWILLPQHPQRARWFEATALLAQFATGLNPLGLPFYTGLGDEGPRSSTHLDSYFTKFGRGSEPAGQPLGQVPGLLIFGPSDHRGGGHWERAVTDKLYPPWDQLPRQRRWGDGWPAIGQNEVLTTNMAYQALAYTFLASVPAEDAAAPRRPPPPAPAAP